MAMMVYTLGKYRFRSEREYQAARRDARKIAGLSRTGRSTADIARNYKRQVKEKQITFETKVGEGFLTGLDKTLFLEPSGSTSIRSRVYTQPELPIRNEEPEPQPAYGEEGEIYRGSRRLNAFKAGTIIAFTLTFAVVAYALVMQVLGDLRSNRNLHELSDLADANRPVQEAEPVLAAPTVPVNTPDTEITIPEQPVQRAIMPQYEALYAHNTDLVGWLRIPDTVIDYPVMFVEDDNDYYLKHNFDGEEDQNGLLVLDKRCEPDAGGANILIHGHNMQSGVMFGTLYLFRDYAYYENHQRIYFDSLYEERVYEIIAVFVSSVYNSNANEFAYYDYINIESEEDFNTYVTTAKDLSLYDTGKTAEYGDELITLSTCEYSRANGRLVILGRRIR
ncbi:MAG: class B sortase [Lachnospiraceae bacterium]|nr:class B sortase [Lachnospiraceae bacterium]